MIMKLAPHNNFDTQFLYGVYEYNSVKLLKRIITKNTLFIDVGANVGYYSLIVSENNLSSCILAYEANPESAERLRYNIALNRSENIDVREVAIGNETRSVEISMFGHYGAGSHIGQSEMAAIGLEKKYKLKISKKMSVQMTTLDRDALDFVTTWKGRKIMKMDIEGSEPRALEGALQTLNELDFLIVEQNEELLEGAGYQRNAASQFLLGNGFQVFLINDRGPLNLKSVSKSSFCNGNLFCVRHADVAAKFATMRT